MKTISPEDLKATLKLFKDGFIFEEFAKSFLSAYYGESFIPVGNIKDRGIDGLEHIVGKKNDTKIYQVSIEIHYENKIKSTIEKLKENNISFSIFTYFTNQIVKNKDLLIEKLYDACSVHCRIYDGNWISSNINYSQGTILAFQTFIDSYFSEFEKPGKSIELIDSLSDPRLFVFLRQQWDYEQDKKNLNIILVDTLILFSLEGTDPDQNKFMSLDDIKSVIKQKLSFPIELLSDTIEKRLKKLSKKPRKIKHHTKIDKYCLPYETRIEIEKRNINDIALENTFFSEIIKKLKKYLKEDQIRVTDYLSLIRETLNKIYYTQGLEFSDYIIKGENPNAVEKQLFDIISSVISDSSVIIKNKEKVKSALIMTIRDVVYNGTNQEKEYLNRLSHTYMMLFLLKCEPRLTRYFEDLASKMTLYVGSSILIPAFSEFYLEEHNKRHWNLIKGAFNSGVNLVINEFILDELVAHFKKIILIYNNHYAENENFYIEDENQVLYINEILIRAYIYAKQRELVKTFTEFIDNFVNYDLSNVKEDLIEWLKEEFGISYLPTKKSGVEINEEDYEKLMTELTEKKGSKKQAECDAKTILSIYGIREKNNETASAGIFGFKTWWLSKEEVTYKTVSMVLGKKHNVSCYIRPDFLYNYISLSPNSKQIKDSYTQIFPTLLGVNISYHLPENLVNIIHEYINEHKGKNQARVKGIIRSLIEKLKSDPSKYDERKVRHFLDQKKKELEV